MSGIQKKYLNYMCTLLILALVLSSICVWTYVRRNMTDVIVDKYEFMNEKMGIALDNLYRKTDAVTAEIILENDVQKSLKNKELQEVEKNTLSKYFAYIDLNHVADYCYIDNKKNVYAKSYSQIGYSDFQSSGLREKWGMSMRRRSDLDTGLPVWHGGRSFVYRKICEQYGLCT